MQQIFKKWGIWYNTVHQIPVLFLTIDWDEKSMGDVLPYKNHHNSIFSYVRPGKHFLCEKNSGTFGTVVNKVSVENTP